MRKATEIILQYMEEQGISYREVARRTGRSAQNVWNVLNGKDGNRKDGTKGRREPNYKTVVDICSVLGLKITIQPNGEAQDPEALTKAAELEYIPFSAVQRILEAGGYSMQIEAPEKNPEKTHKI